MVALQVVPGANDPPRSAKQSFVPPVTRLNALGLEPKVKLEGKVYGRLPILLSEAVDKVDEPTVVSGKVTEEGGEIFRIRLLVRSAR
jgi:hypothetical protein